MSRISREAKYTNPYDNPQHKECACQMCQARHESVPIDDEILFNLDLLSDELVRVFLPVFVIGIKDSPLHLDRANIMRITGMSADRVELAIIEGIRIGIIRERILRMDEESQRIEVDFNGEGIKEFFYDRAPKFTLGEFLQHHDQPVPGNYGFIYAIHDGVNATKIGMTSNIETRLKAYKTHSARELDVVGVWVVNEMSYCEDALHKFFQRYHIRGEWFELPAVLLRWLRNGAYKAAGEE